MLAQAPTDASFELAKRRAGMFVPYEMNDGVLIDVERDALAAMEAMRQAQAQAAAAREAELTKTMEQTEMDITYNGLTTTNASVPSAKPGVKKKPGKPKLTAKEKKERSVRASFFSPLIIPNMSPTRLRLKKSFPACR